jgi:hypothetical protein
MGPSEVFGKSKWHPGRLQIDPQLTLIHAINVNAGGLLFDIP